MLENKNILIILRKINFDAASLSTFLNSKISLKNNLNDS